MTSRHPLPAPRLAIGLALATVVASLPLGALTAGATGSPPSGTGRTSNLVFAPTITGLVSISPAGAAGQGTTSGISLSGDGRYVAWSDNSDNLVAGDTNGFTDDFVRDMVSDVTERVDVSSAGKQADGASNGPPSISRTGRFVVFASYADNLVPGDTNAKSDVFLRDRLNHTTERVSLTALEGQSAGASSSPVVSGDGRYIAFQSDAADLLPGDTNGAPDVYVRDRQLGNTVRVSVNSAEGQAPAASAFPAMSNDGRYITFASASANLVANDTNAKLDVFERDTQAGTTVRASIGASQGQGDDTSGSSPSPVSDDGRFVAFESSATNLIATDTNNTADVFRRDLAGATTARVSVASGGTQGNGPAVNPSLSADGNVVAFAGIASNLVPGDTNGDTDTFVRTVGTATTVRQSVTSDGSQLAGGTLGYVKMSADGGAVAFASNSTDVVTDPGGPSGHVFLRRKAPTAPFSTVDGLVQQQAVDFGQGNLTQAQRNAHVARILSGFPSYQRFATDLAHSPAWSGTRGPVTRLYWAFFQRKPDTSGINHWINKIQSGSKLNAVALEFSRSSEFKNKYGQLSDEEFVGLVYVNVLNRASDPAGQAHWEAKLAGGMTRGQMMTAFSESSEGIRKMAPQTDVVLLSLAMLKVVPTAAQFVAWRSLAAGAGSLEDVVTQIFALPAYGSRITP